MLRKTFSLLLLVLLILTSCGSGKIFGPKFTPSPIITPTSTYTVTSTEIETSFKPLLTPTEIIKTSLKSTPLPTTISLDPANWQNWPVLPIIPEHTRQIYLLGQSLGNNPHAFSVFGDCNSLPEVFMGIYETDLEAVTGLPLNLQETVAWFSGSFNRESPTVRAGTTTGALLWAQWHQNKYTCIINETPLHCELRIHKPTFVIIQVGSHYETRNKDYMRTILDQLIKAGVVPILANKADDIDPDQHVNLQYAELAVEYNIPFWNFWAALNSLPNHGLYSRPEDTYQGGLYLTDEAAAIHRKTALQVLDLVRRVVTEP